MGIVLMPGLAMLSACSNKEMIKPEPVTIYVPQQIPLPPELTSPCRPPKLTKETKWGEALALYAAALSECADKIDKIRAVQI